MGTGQLFLTGSMTPGMKDCVGSLIAFARGCPEAMLRGVPQASDQEPRFGLSDPTRDLHIHLTPASATHGTTESAAVVVALAGLLAGQAPRADVAVAGEAPHAGDLCGIAGFDRWAAESCVKVAGLRKVVVSTASVEAVRASVCAAGVELEIQGVMTVSEAIAAVYS